MDRCEICSKEWRERYEIAVSRFDRALAIACTITIISVCVALAGVIVAAMCVSETHKFIKQFEYVEETIIEQDGNGKNVAVIQNGG